MNKINPKEYLPHAVVLLVFVLITLIYLSPLLEGKRIWQSDIAQHLGASKEINDYRTRTGEEPLWTNSMFGGMPAYQVSTVYKGNLLGYADQILMLGLPQPAGLVFLYFVGFFILLMVLRLNPWLAMAGALAYGFSSFFFIIIEVGHNSQAHAIGYIAPVIAGLILTFRGKYLWGGLMTALFFSLEVKANHPQITYYLALIGLLLGIFQLTDDIRNGKILPFIKSVGVIIVALLFAVLTNITTLWATWEYGKYTSRSKTELTTGMKPEQTNGLDKDYITQYSYGIPETMTLLIPNFQGGASVAPLKEKSEVVAAMKANGLDPSTISQFIDQPVPYYYWGNQFSTAGPVYVGAVICFLFVLGLILVRGGVKWWLLTATILSVFLAWGHNFMAFSDLFIQWVPGYNKFRAVTMTLVIAEFSMPLLGILAVKELFDPKTSRSKGFRALVIAFSIIGGITLFFALFPGMLLNFVSPNDARMATQLPDWMMQAIRDERKSLLRMDAFRGFIWITLAALVLLAALYQKLKYQYAMMLLAVIFLADMFPVNKRYLNNKSFTSRSKAEVPFEPGPADQQILQDPDPDYRVYNLTVDPFSDASTSYFHKSIGGYSGVKMRRYQELIEYQIRKQNMAVLNMLNTKYFIVPDEKRNPVAQYNPGALGHAWFVYNYQIAESADAELNTLTGFRPDSVAVVGKEFAGQLTNFQPGRDTTDKIGLESYAPNKLQYRYKTAANRLAVFSEIYYPKGWNAYIDGTPATHFRANYVLRAMVLPAGEHQLEFRFEPVVYPTGERIARFSSLALILLTIVAVVMYFLKSTKKTTSPS